MQIVSTFDFPDVVENPGCIVLFQAVYFLYEFLDLKVDKVLESSEAAFLQSLLRLSRQRERVNVMRHSPADGVSDKANSRFYHHFFDTFVFERYLPISRKIPHE